MFLFNIAYGKNRSTLGNNFALFVGGSAAVTESSIEKYYYDTDVVQMSSTYLTTARYGLAGCGNTEKGYFGFGRTGNTLLSTIEAFTYARETITSYSSLNGRNYIAAASNADQGYFAGGGNTSNQPNAINTKFLFSSNTSVNSTALSVARLMLAAAGNSVIALFAGGYNGLTATTYKTVDIFNHINDSRIVGTSLSVLTNSLAAFGNQEFGIFSGGGASVVFNTTSEYVYATNAITASTTLQNARKRHCGTGNSEKGIIACGIIGAIKTNLTEKFNYTDKTIISGSSLITGREFAGSSSSSPGGF